MPGKASTEFTAAPCTAAGVVTEVNKGDARGKPYTVEYDKGEVHHYR
jgi:hypothetical protein